MSTIKEPSQYCPDDLPTYVERNDLAAVEVILKGNGHLANKLYGGRTLLAQPCRRGRNGMVRLLLNHGVGVDNCYANGLTPLWTAVFYNHEDTVKVLVESGADIEGHCYLPNFRSLDYAIVYGFYEIALFLYQTSPNKQLKPVEEYEKIKKEFKVGQFVDFNVVIEGLQHGTPPSQLLDYLKRPKISRKEEEDGCCSWCCGLFVFDPKRDLPQGQPETNRRTLSANPEA